MFADACMELEMLEGKDRMADATLHCRWTIYRDSENWLGARSMAAEMARTRSEGFGVANKERTCGKNE